MFATSRARIAAIGSILAFVAVIVTALTVTSASRDIESGSASGSPVATFRINDETYKIELATPELVEHAEALLDGQDVSAIPNGKVVRDDPGVNAPWSWHIDPSTLEFAFVTIEVCDGMPSYVEDGTVTSDYFCPWSAKIVSIDY